METKNEALELAQIIDNDGKGCKCRAYSSSECACGAIWTEPSMKRISAMLLAQAAEIERLTGGDVDLPEPVLYAHELVRNKGGVWLAVGQKGICEQSHVDGETGAEIKELYAKGQLIDYGNHRAATAWQASRTAALADAKNLCHEIATNNPEFTARFCANAIGALK